MEDAYRDASALAQRVVHLEQENVALKKKLEAALAKGSDPPSIGLTALSHASALAMGALLGFAFLR